ncbi:hypothetical protein FAES_5046 [Fibrella aestuarina BUZ 2]|uniref:Uncharacterized protein n=1 Tax=Fibrella aestuarina BUZ 2 TaxID=1166018 RepID=I0KFZ2_9BACT|nr:hypothetical protein FAES_5046 [Fibrella aestuarina BUZ 2]
MDTSATRLYRRVCLGTLPNQDKGVNPPGRRNQLAPELANFAAQRK